MAKVNATQFLRNDHKRLRGLIAQVDTLDLRAPEMKDGVIREFFMEIEIHSAVEEEFFYPQLSARVDANFRALIDQSLKDHESIRHLVMRLRELEPSQEEYDGSMGELISQLEPHLDQEEIDLFHAAERAMDPAQLEELGAKMQKRREEHLRLPQYKYALPEEVQDPHGGEQKRKVA